MANSSGIEWLYEDNHLLGIFKPAGLLSQADRTGDPDVVSLARSYLKIRFNKPGNVYVGLVHRLDRPVSGAMVLARTSKAAGRLSNAFRERRVRKKYLAVLEGRLTGRGVLHNAIHKDTRTGRVSIDPVRGKEAVLQYQVLGGIGQETLVEISLKTGRPHQIRCQFAHKGFPLVGDLRYGAPRQFDGRNLALHCVELAFEHPVRPKTVVIRAALPVTWARYAALF
ncbi:MAG: RluA family pseudouridine synthase [Bacteroidota bacterium]|nr:RluA family pseudouridine synthase [Bacteroidota bacterium]